LTEFDVSLHSTKFYTKSNVMLYCQSLLFLSCIKINRWLFNLCVKAQHFVIYDIINRVSLWRIKTHGLSLVNNFAKLATYCQTKLQAYFFTRDNLGNSCRIINNLAAHFNFLWPNDCIVNNVRTGNMYPWYSFLLISAACNLILDVPF
jgi:hypothetical protein